MNKAEIISRHAQALKNQVGTSLAIDLIINTCE